MSIDSAHKSWWQISEVVFGLPFLIAIALQRVAPLSFPRGLFTAVTLLGGVALIIVGIAFIVRARQEFAQHGQPTDPGRPTTRVVTTGMFSFSRNPIYLGAVCVFAGIALAANLPWVLVLLLPAIAACHFILIMPEERYLVAKFGKEYRAYAATVHRWIGRARIPRER